MWLLQSYEYNTTEYGEPSDKAIAAIGKNIVNLTNVGDKHDVSVQMYKAISEISDKSEKQRERGYAEFGKLLNNNIPHIPLLRQGKNVLEFASWVAGGEEKPMPPFPNNFLQGALYGGIIQDACGLVPEQYLPDPLKDWGIPTQDSVMQ